MDKSRVQKLTDNFFFFKEDLIEILRNNDKFAYCYFSLSQEGISGFQSDWSFSSRVEASSYAKRRVISGWVEWFCGCAWVSSFFNNDILYMSHQAKNTPTLLFDFKKYTGIQQFKNQLANQPYQAEMPIHGESVKGCLKANLLFIDENTTWVVWEFTPDS